MKRKIKEKIKYGLFLIPLLLIVIFFLVVPIVSVVEGSLELMEIVYIHFITINIFFKVNFIDRDFIIV